MTAEEVKALQVGECVTIRKEGHEPILCTVAFREHPANKFLTYRDHGLIKKFAIRDYPDMEYMRVSGDRESGLLSAGSTPAALTKKPKGRRK